MLRSLGVVVAGLVIGFVLVMAFELAGMRLFPLPAGVDPMGDPESLARAMQAGQVPLGAMVFVVLAYAAGSFGGGWVAARLAAARKLRHALVVGGVLMLAGVSNLVTIPHPTWMVIATLVVFLPLAYAGGRLAQRGAAGG